MESMAVYFQLFTRLWGQCRLMSSFPTFPFSCFSSNQHVGVICIAFIVFCPVVNTLTYTLSNKEEKESMWKLWQGCRFSWDKLGLQDAWGCLPTDCWQAGAWKQSWNPTWAIPKMQMMFRSSSLVYLSFISSLVSLVPLSALCALGALSLQDRWGIFKCVAIHRAFQL